MKSQRLLDLQSQTKRPRFTLHVLVPTATGAIRPETEHSIQELHSFAQSSYGATVRRHFIQAMPVALARNALADQALRFAKEDPTTKHLCLWVDSDVAFQHEAFAAIFHEYQRHHGIIHGISGVYCLRGNFQEPVISVEGRELVCGVDFEVGDVCEVDAPCMGFMLHSLDLLQQIERPCFQSDPSSRDCQEGGLGGEDLAYFKKLKTAGFRLWAHTGAVARHIDRVSGISYLPAAPANLKAFKSNH